MDNKHEIDALLRQAKKLQTNVEQFVVVLDPEEIELVDRILRAVFPQMKKLSDKQLAQKILKRTEWIRWKNK